MTMFAHYSPWVASFSENIHPLTQITSFPLLLPVIKAFESLKRDIASSALDPSVPLVVETDAPDCAIAP